MKIIMVLFSDLWTYLIVRKHVKHTQQVVESHDLFRDNSLDKIKKIITQEIHKITDKKKLKSVYYILKT